MRVRDCVCVCVHMHADCALVYVCTCAHIHACTYVCIRTFVRLAQIYYVGWHNIKVI